MSVIQYARRRRLGALLRYLDVTIRTNEREGKGTAGLKRFRADLSDVLKNHGGVPE